MTELQPLIQQWLDTRATGELLLIGGGSDGSKLSAAANVPSYDTFHLKKHGIVSRYQRSPDHLDAIAFCVDHPIRGVDLDAVNRGDVTPPPRERSILKKRIQ
ncbi:hypothetical protein [Lacunimicrobium album]